MGARPYQPALGRFITVDPKEGGCSNNYTYAFGDPTNHPDLTGQGFGWHNITGFVGRAASCVGNVFSGYSPVPTPGIPLAAATLSGLGATVGALGVDILLGATTAGFAATGVGFIIVGGIALYAGVGWALSNC
jgi:hypothetical protein